MSNVRGQSVVTGLGGGHPLRLLTPKNHGHAAWVYQSSLGGGFVGQDDVSMDVRVEQNAALFLTSQASSKVYRAARSRFTLNAHVGSQATLISFPDPIVCFRGAGLLQKQHFRLATDASALIVDAYSAGRVASDERWAHAALDTCLFVDIDDRRVFSDGLLLSPAHGELRTRMASVEVLATVLVIGSALRTLAEALHAQLTAEPLRRPDEALLCVSSLHAFGAVIRIAAPSVERYTATVRSLLRPAIAQLLGDDPLARKW